MGTHSSNPSYDLTTGRSLLDVVQENQALMSGPIAKKYNNKLPFLFKVLSVAKALSIQAHPNKKLAAQLREKDPEHYPDDNHKPEMTIAITPFEGLCGFRPLDQIAQALRQVHSLRELVGEDAAKKFEDQVSSNSEDEEANKKALREIFTSLMQSDSSEIQRLAPKLLQQAKDEDSNFCGGKLANASGSDLAALLQRLNSQFENDIGLFVLFFLNYVTLDIGESMFLKADDIHAYLAGDIMECMAASDNVVRAGFTPKFKDIDTLTSMLTYDHAPIDEQKLQTQDYPHCKFNSKAFSSNSNCILYDPPIEEFSVLRTVLGSEGGKVTFDPIDGPAIVICTQGHGKISVGPKVEEIKEGWVYFVGATAEVVMENSGQDEFVTYKAFCELDEAEVNGNGTTNGHAEGRGNL